MRAILAVIGAAALAAGCAGGYNQPPPKPLPPNPHAIKVHKVWSHGIGGGGGRQLLGLAAENADGTLFAASAHGHVAAFAAETGKQIWSRHLDARLSAGPAVGDGLVVVGTRTGEVIALAAATGEKQWQHYVGAPVLANPAVATQIVVVKTLAGDLVGLTPETGATIWEINERPPSLTLRFGIQPLIVDGVAYGGFADGNVAAVDAATGEEQWRSQIAQPSGNNPVTNMISVGGIMAWASGDLYAVTYQGRLVALSAFSGQVLWSRELSSYTGVTLDGAYLYVSDAAGRVHAFDLVTGVPVWVYEKLGYRRLSAAVPFGPVVAVGDRFGWLHFLDRDDGHYLNRVKVSDGPIRMPPVVADGRLIVLDDDGTLAAYTVEATKS